MPVAALAGAARVGVVGDVEAFADGCEELVFGRASVQVFDDAVVGENLHLVGGEDDGEEAVVLLLARVVRGSASRSAARARLALAARWWPSAM